MDHRVPGGRRIRGLWARWDGFTRAGTDPRCLRQAGLIQHPATTATPPLELALLRPGRHADEVRIFEASPERYATHTVFALTNSLMPSAPSSRP